MNGRTSAAFVRSIFVLLLLFPVASLHAQELPAQKTHQAAHQNPFDLAAGGASLTRATQEGALFVNPSLPAFGPGLFRWVYFRTTLHAGAEASDFALDLADKKITNQEEILKRALKTPLHAGVDLHGGVVTSLAGLGVFSDTRADVEARSFGSSGLPEIRLRAQSTNGGVVTSSKLLAPWLALGVATKYVYAGHYGRAISLIDIQAVQEEIAQMRNKLQYGFGKGLDIGLTVQAQSRYVDGRVAVVLEDVGDTKFSNSLPAWKQKLNGGVAAIFHWNNHSVHCAVDVRDILEAYEEHWTFRTYTGCKGLFARRVGLAAGYSQGWLTYGAVLNLTIMRLEGGVYTREMGLEAGTVARPVYFLATSIEI